MHLRHMEVKLMKDKILIDLEESEKLDPVDHFEDFIRGHRWLQKNLVEYFNWIYEKIF